MKRIHIVGLNPRTGTTLLAECMRVCFDIDGYEEHEAPLYKMRWGKSIYLTKNPQDLFYMKWRFFLDPRVTVICMVRDPRDVVVSKHGKDPDNYWMFTNLGRWKERHRLLRCYIPHDRIVVIRYEDLIENPDDVQNYIASKIKYLKKKRPFSQFHHGSDFSRESSLALKGVRPIDKDNVSKWRAHLPRLRQQLVDYGPITEELIDWGYERDDSWLKLIDDYQNLPASGRKKVDPPSANLNPYRKSAMLGLLAYLIGADYG
jgi:Sulfotransferase family